MFFEREHLVYDEDANSFSLVYEDEDYFLIPEKEYCFIRIDYNPILDFEVENIGIDNFLEHLLSKEILENKLIKWNTNFPLHYPSVTYFTVEMYSSRDYYTGEYDFEYWLDEIFDEHFNKNKISDVRKDALHKVTSYLSKNHTQIVIEDLNVKGMVKNHKLASAILDGGFFEFKRQLQYKCDWYGSKLTVVDRFFPSSKTCSGCGVKKQVLKLSERTFVCESCGFECDRDLNAAINLKNKAASYAVTACGAINHDGPLGLAIAVKQEKNDKVLNFV